MRAIPGSINNCGNLGRGCGPDLVGRALLKCRGPDLKERTLGEHEVAFGQIRGIDQFDDGRMQH